jgi:cytochrome c oxidase assembly protein Cox11
MLYLFYFFFITLNMLFFGVLNIPLFKYFCDIPSYNFLLDDNVTSYFYSKVCNLDNSFYFSFYNSNLNYFFSSFLYNDVIFYGFYSLSIYFFYFDLYINNFISSCDYIEVLFQTSTSNYNFVEFCTLQKYIYIIPNETHLIFFRMYNTVSFEITGISIYLLYPTDFLVYFNKIQCFCFEELLLYPYESIDLPVIFFVSNEILNYVDFFYSNKLYLSYLFLVR